MNKFHLRKPTFRLVVLVYMCVCSVNGNNMYTHKCIQALVLCVSGINAGTANRNHSNNTRGLRLATNFGWNTRLTALTKWGYLPIMHIWQSSNILLKKCTFSRTIVKAKCKTRYNKAYLHTYKQSSAKLKPFNKSPEEFRRAVVERGCVIYAISTRVSYGGHIIYSPLLHK